MGCVYYCEIESLLHRPHIYNGILCRARIQIKKEEEDLTRAWGSGPAPKIQIQQLQKKNQQLLTAGPNAQAAMAAAAAAQGQAAKAVQVVQPKVVDKPWLATDSKAEIIGDDDEGGQLEHMKYLTVVQVCCMDC